MHDKSMIIIGGGIAGLSAGCYGLMNGFRARIFEMHNLPGGLCTSWKRQNYTVNGCIHWLAGSAPQTKLYHLWEELGAIQERNFIYTEEYSRIESADGKTFIVYSNIDRLEQHMKEIAPEDNKVIDEFINAVRRCTRFDPPIEKAPEVYGLLDVLNLIIPQFPLLRMLWKWNRISLTQFSMRFKNPLLREAFPLISMPENPMFFVLMTLALMHNKAAGYPVGGSLEFSRAIEKRYITLGGEINYKAKAMKILVERGYAVGVKLEDGTEHYADYIISAADGHATIFEMLEGKYVDDTIKGCYDNRIPAPPWVYMTLGVDRRFDDMPRCIGDTVILLKDPIMIGGKEQQYISLHIYNFDPTLAPAGKTILRVAFNADWIYWKKLRENDEQYTAEKEKVANIVVSFLDKRFPGLAAQVEMCDVATPTTFEHYTGNWDGSPVGWQVSSKTWSKLIKKTLPGLKNFYMAGQWVEPGGGVPIAAMSGRNVVQIICKEEKRRFRNGRQD